MVQPLYLRFTGQSACAGVPTHGAAPPARRGGDSPIPARPRRRPAPSEEPSERRRTAAAPTNDRRLDRRETMKEGVTPSAERPKIPANRDMMHPMRPIVARLSQDYARKSPDEPAKSAEKPSYAMQRHDLRLAGLPNCERAAFGGFMPSENETADGMGAESRQTRKNAPPRAPADSGGISLVRAARRVPGAFWRGLARRRAARSAVSGRPTPRFWARARATRRRS